MRANLSQLRKSLAQKTEIAASFDFLEAKLALRFSLCTQLVFYALKKVNGDEMEDSVAFLNLAYFRELCRKIGPIQERLTSHIEEIVKYGDKVA